ncbi:MAG: signal peptidase I [Bryobacteraceae bacterium]
MTPQPSSPPAAVRRGFWMALALGCLSLVVTALNPLAGAVFAAIYFAIAWGIRRRQFWAAVAGVAMLALAAFKTIGAWGAVPAAEVMIAAVFPLAAMLWMAWTAVALWRDPQASRRSVGWVAFLVVLAVCGVCLHPYYLSAGSMENTLLVGDCVMTENLTWSLGRTPKRGDVVMVRYPLDPKQIFIKRVVGVPGDRLHLVNKQLYRNGQPVVEPYAIHKTDYVDSYRDNFPSEPMPRLQSLAEGMLQNHVREGEVEVPPGRYFVLGDNRDDSLDSRYWGFIGRAAIVGSPILIYESFDGPQMATHMRWNRVLKLL